MSDLIFGSTFEQIQQMQQGIYNPEMIRGPIDRPAATDKDLALFKKHGESGLLDMQYHGVLDRLRTSKII